MREYLPRDHFRNDRAYRRYNQNRDRQRREEWIESNAYQMAGGVTADPVDKEMARADAKASLKRIERRRTRRCRSCKRNRRIATMFQRSYMTCADCLDAANRRSAKKRKAVREGRTFDAILAMAKDVADQQGLRTDHFVSLHQVIIAARSATGLPLEEGREITARQHRRIATRKALQAIATAIYARQ
ncbi:hypothetical protein FKB34_08745 [Glycocaulis profundi]|nr:hypothetical protein FKB34_08745 [Glycocaulis profundi]